MADAHSFIWQSGLLVYMLVMPRLISPQIRTLPIAIVLIGAGACWSTASVAQTAPPTASAPTNPVPSEPADTIRLTDQQRTEITDNITEDSAAAARGELTESQRKRLDIHGEIGVMIGSNGTRGIYGTTEIPLGDNAAAAVSFESSRYGYGRYRR